LLQVQLRVLSSLLSTITLPHPSLIIIAQRRSADPYFCVISQIYNMKVCGLIFPVVALALLGRSVDSATKALSIKEANKFCEAEVPRHCISTTCPLWCSSLRSPSLKNTCSSECNADKRCKLRPFVGNDDPLNMVLDAQNRDQLVACIAEKRDPTGATTGRRETPWKELETRDFKKAVRGT